MGHENGGWMNSDQREHSEYLSKMALKTHGCKDCGEERLPRTVGWELSCSECGSKNIVCIEPDDETRVFTNCNVCGIKLRTKDEDQMGMCERCADE